MSDLGNQLSNEARVLRIIDRIDRVKFRQERDEELGITKNNAKYEAELKMREGQLMALQGALELS